LGGFREFGMVIELRGALLGVVAGLVAVGIAFSVAWIARSASGKPAPAAPAASARQSLTGAEVIGNGSALYTQYCASCHGSDAKGSFGPSLRGLALSNKSIAATIENGKDPMPAFGNQLKPQEIDALVGYVRALK
jgi:mono/diheme cytochrome c family protein